MKPSRSRNSASRACVFSPYQSLAASRKHTYVFWKLAALHETVFSLLTYSAEEMQAACAGYPEREARILLRRLQLLAIRQQQWHRLTTLAAGRLAGVVRGQREDAAYGKAP